MLEQRYMFEYEVGLWTFGTMQIRREHDSGDLKMIRTIPKSQLKSTGGVMSKLMKLKDLKHPHIVALTDALEDRSNFYVVSDMCQGGDIQNWMERFIEEGYHMQEQTIQAYLRHLLLALVHCHSRGIFHRDLRPSCLNLTSKMPDATVKVTDMGLAEIFDPFNTLVHINPQRRCSNPFTAPEVLDSTETVFDSAPDMWSVGALAHAMLVGRPPAQEIPDAPVGDGTTLAAIIGRLRGTTNKSDAAWAERSPMARDFVRQLLVPAEERMTPAKSLHHPWLRNLMPIASPSPKADVKAREARFKRLCYSLAVLLIPSLMSHTDFELLRAGFLRQDKDQDGFVLCYVVSRIILSRCPVEKAVMPAVRIADVEKTDALDLCGTACADLIAREFFKDVASSREAQSESFRATDLAPMMLKRFFEVYGDGPGSVVTVPGMRSMLRTATMADMEAHAHVSYKDIFSTFPRDSVINSEFLVSQLGSNLCLGTPQGPAVNGHVAMDTTAGNAETFLTSFFGGFGLGTTSRR